MPGNWEGGVIRDHFPQASQTSVDASGQNPRLYMVTVGCVDICRTSGIRV